MDLLFKMLFIIINVYILIRISGVAGKLSEFKDYASFSRMGSENGFGFNIVFRILTPFFYTIFLFILIKIFGLTIFISSLWFIPFIYYLFQIIATLLKGKLFLTNFPALLITSVVGTVLIFYVNKFLLNISNIAQIFPSFSEIRSELWLIFILYLYSIYNKKGISYGMWEERALRKIEKRYLLLVKKYNKHLSIDFKKNKILNDILFSIMLYEDLNRPNWFRNVERLLFYVGVTKTLGIMQVTSEKVLTDLESITMAEEIILTSYDNTNRKDCSQFETALYVIGDYNMDAYYRGEVSDIFHSIANFSSNLRSQYWQDVKEVKYIGK